MHEWWLWGRWRKPSCTSHANSHFPKTLTASYEYYQRCMSHQRAILYMAVTTGHDFLCKYEMKTELFYADYFSEMADIIWGHCTPQITGWLDVMLQTGSWLDSIGMYVNTSGCKHSIAYHYLSHWLYTIPHYATHCFHSLLGVQEPAT